MNLNIISWSISILGFLVLVFYVRQKNKKRILKMLSPLHEFANENNSTVTSLDHWDKTLIGMDDSEKSKLFYMRKVHGAEVKLAIYIPEIKTCRLVKTIRTAHLGKEKVSVIDRISVVISFKNTKKTDVELEFYNTDYDNLNLSGELQFAEKWTKLINSQIAVSGSRIKKPVDDINISSLQNLRRSAAVF